MGDAGVVRDDFDGERLQIEQLRQPRVYSRARVAADALSSAV